MRPFDNEETPWRSHDDRRFAAAVAVILVDVAQVIPYGMHDMTESLAATLNPWEWAITALFAICALLTTVAVFIGRPRLFTEAVYASGGLYAITTIAVLSSLTVPANVRFMLATTFAGVTLGLFTLWLSLRRVPS